MLHKKILLRFGHFAVDLVVVQRPSNYLHAVVTDVDVAPCCVGCQAEVKVRIVQFAAVLLLADGAGLQTFRNLRKSNNTLLTDGKTIHFEQRQ